jgi:hypothetical protein
VTIAVRVVWPRWTRPTDRIAIDEEDGWTLYRIGGT